MRALDSKRRHRQSGVLPALHPRVADRPGSLAHAGAGHGWQRRRAGLPGSAAECPVPRTCLAPGLGGRHGQQRAFPGTDARGASAPGHRAVAGGGGGGVCGDGEFAGISLQAAVEEEGHAYVCRTAHNILVYHEEVWRPLRAMGVAQGACLMGSGVGFPQANYALVQVIAWWEAGYAEPLYLVTNLTAKAKACGWYRKCAHIETCFSDQKSRGFQVHKSHLADPARLARLMIAACLAYLWLIYLGALAARTHWRRVIHRTDRCDLILFQLGLRLLEHFLNEALPIPVILEFRLTRNNSAEPSAGQAAP